MKRLTEEEIVTLRKTAIDALAKLFLDNNIDNASACITDDPTLDFSKFGTDSETINAMLQHQDFAVDLELILTELQKDIDIHDFPAI